MTRKTAALLAAFAAVSVGAQAQGPWGVKASLDINAPGKWKAGDTTLDMYRSGIGFSAGVRYSNYFNDNLYLEPSLSFFYDSYSTDIVIGEDAANDSRPGVYKLGLRLPVVLGYTFDLSDDFAVSVFTGPEASYAFGGGYRIKDSQLKAQLDDWSLFGSEDGMQRRLSCSWKGGLGVPFGDWMVDFEAAVGLTDIITGPASCRENRYTFTLTRYF